MIAAEMEFENGQYAQAQNRAEFVIANIQELTLICDASVDLKKKIDDLPGGKPTRTVNPYLPGYSIFIAKYPYVDSELVDSIAGRISEEYGLQVKIVGMGVDESELNMRNKQLTAYEEIITDVMSRYPKAKVDDYLKEIGLTRADLEKSDGKRKFVYALLIATEPGMAQWLSIEKMAKQYSANALLAQVSGTLAEYGNEKRSFGVLGITKNDLYESDYNFLFGYARKTWGVMSYARFSLGNPSAEQFQKRAVMQAMSSVGLILGIPRCTNPTCARAYPNSLEEQDRKSDALCEDCRKRAVQLYAQYQ